MRTIRFTAFAAIAVVALVVAMAGQRPGGGNSAASQEIVRPKKAEPRIRKLSATIEPYETARIFARVSGFLVSWEYDIGDRVKRDTLLAKLYVPELEGEVGVEEARVQQGRARVQTAQERVEGAAAELEAAKFAVEQAELAAKSAASTAKFRASQFKRMKDLLARKAIDESVLDESQERHAAAVDAEKSAQLAVGIAKLHVVMDKVKVNKARADVDEAKLGVAIARLKADNLKDWLSQKYIKAPFDGFITERNGTTDDFVRPANDRPKQKPLYVMQRTNIVRVVVAVPEADIPLIRDGDAADVEVAAFPGKKWPAKITRTSGAVDPKTGCMRAEIHLRNDDESLRPGMSGTVTIRLADRK